MIDELIHEQYESDGQLVLFRCRECNHTSMSLGSLHAHAEKHRNPGVDPWNIIVPPWRMADIDELMGLTEIVRVDEATEITIEEVEGL